MPESYNVQNDENENIKSEESVTSEKQELPVQNINFIDHILEFITGTRNEERIKLKKLKNINKDLNQLKYKFYNYKKDQILPGFAHYFYEIYRLTQNIVRFFDVKVHSDTIKQFLFESAIPKKQFELKQKLEKDKIEELLKQTRDIKKSIDEIKKILSDFVKSFDPEVVHNINTTFNHITDVSNLTNFDWFFLVHKFDSAISEGNFNYKPNFEHLDGKYVLDELISINDYLHTLNLNSDWKNVFDYLKSISGESGQVNVLKKLIQIFRNLKRDDYLTKMIKLISKNPDFKPKQFNSKSKIVQDYIRAYQFEVQNIVQQLIREMNKEKINKLLLEIFRSTVIVRLKNYSQKLNDSLLNKGISNGLKYVEPLNYLKAFLLDICKGEIKPRIDLLIIKGTWDTNNHSAVYSTLLTNFNTLSDRILELDNRCAEEESYGREIKRLYNILKHDPKARLVIKKVLAKIDSEAIQIIIDSIHCFIDSSGKIKILIDDYNSKAPSILINFHKIKWDFSGDLKFDLTEIFKKLHNIVVLLKNFVKEENPDENS